jgi:pSer/pThr/pTyr-binding forkhead associated (FHA) protein
MGKNQNYDIIYKNLSGRNLLVYNFINEEGLIRYQLEMLANNRIKGILQSEVIRINGEICLQYDITSLVNIKKLFERRKLCRKDFLYILKQIVEILGIMEQYLLDSSRIVFDSTYIFTDPQNLELGFVYLPLNDKPQNLDSLKDFLLDAIINDIRFIDEPSDNFIQRLIELLKAPEFADFTLKKYLNEMNSVEKVPVPNTKKEQIIFQKEFERQLPPQQEMPRKAVGTVQKKKLCYPAKSYYILYSVIGTIALFCIALMSSGILSPSNPDFALSLFGVVLIGGAVTYLVYSKLFAPDKKIERVVEEKTDKKVQSGVAEYVNKAFSIPVAGKTANYKESAAYKELAANKDSIPTLGRKPIFSKENNSPTYERKVPSSNKKTIDTRPFYFGSKKSQTQDRTEILNAGNLMIPHLKRILGNNNEIIILKHFPFMLGRLEGQVDYFINNPAVGKLHAEITKTDEGYLISDMNSRNGTIINGKRIEPTRENIIKSGDHIVLGNEEFIFFCGDTDI